MKKDWKDGEKLSVSFGNDFNFSYIDSDRRSMIAFPFPELISSCPYPAELTISYESGSFEEISDTLASWRKVPEYLGRGLDGHLIVFYDSQSDPFVLERRIREVSARIVGPAAIGHSLCEFRYHI